MAGEQFGPILGAPSTGGGGGGGAGSLLASHEYAPSTIASYALGNTLVALDATNLTLEFTVPANGIVDIDVEMWLEITTNGTGGTIALGLLDHTTGDQVGNTKNSLGWGASADSGPAGTVHNRFHLTDLTPGPMQVDVAGSAVNAGAAYAAAQAYVGPADTGKVSPALIQAFTSL